MNLILGDTIRAVEVVNSNLSEVLDGVVDTEIEGAEVSDTVDGVGGAIAEDDGAGGADEFGEEVESPDGEHVLAGGVGHTLEFINPVLGSEALGEVEGEVEEGRGAVGDDVIGDRFGKPGEGLFDFGDEVVIEEGKDSGDFVLHELALGISHLVGGSVEVEDGEVVGAKTGGVALTVWNSANEGGLVVVNREGVGSGTGVTVGRDGDVVGERDRRSQQQGRDNGEESREKDFHFFYYDDDCIDDESSCERSQHTLRDFLWII